MEDDESLALGGQVDAFMTSWFRARQTVLEANFRRAHQHGLSATQFMLLNLIEHGGPWTLRAVASALRLDATTVLQTVDSLEQRGLVTRTRSTADRRRVHLSLTADGASIQESSQQEFRAALTAIFRAMKPTARRALVTGLTAFADAATALEQESDDATH